MLDETIIIAEGGTGGDGSISFHRTKSNAFGGPDGGRGGSGGNIFITASSQVHTLYDVSLHRIFRAQHGVNGKGNNKTGAAGEDLTIYVPIGTEIWDYSDPSLYRGVASTHISYKKTKREEEEGLDEEEFEYSIKKDADTEWILSAHQHKDETNTDDTHNAIDTHANEENYSSFMNKEHIAHRDYKLGLVADLLVDGETVMVAKGGVSGLGNMSFKTSTNRAPYQKTKGHPGSKITLKLKLKKIADVGLVGFPNIGKSTLLTFLTNAVVKIGNYAFTTLYPNLGVLKEEATGSNCEINKSQEKPIIIADLPGLIKGSSLGKGLGLRFLTHVERCQALLFCIDSTSVTPEEDYETLKSELLAYNPMLCRKKIGILILRTDLEDTNMVINRIKNHCPEISFITSLSCHDDEDEKAYDFAKKMTAWIRETA